MKINSGDINREVSYAKERLKSRREDMRRIVDGMAGRTSLSEGRATRLIENHYHQYASLVVPRIVSGDPRTRVTTARANKARIAAMAGEAYVNEWIKQTQHRILAQRLATDAVLGWGGGVLHLDRRSAFDDDDDDPRAWPIFTRLNQSDFFFDPLGTSWQNKAYSGYDYAILHTDLIKRSEKEEGWYKQAVRNCPVDAALDEIERPKNAPGRGECVVREVWISGFRLPDAPKHSNGTIFTLAAAHSVNGVSSFLRAPMPFFGPPWGPIYLYDIYYVPGQVLGMSPCEANSAHVDSVNRQLAALLRSAEARKKIGIGNLLNREDVELIRTTPEGGMALIQGATRETVFEMELAGPTSEQRACANDALVQLERNSALDDGGRGRAEPGTTATATATASATQGVRTGYVAQRFADCDTEPLRGVLWYVMHSRALKMHIDPAQLGITPEFLKARGMDPADIDSIETEIRGGPDAGLSFDDYTLTLDRYSMERVSEDLMQQRALQKADFQLRMADAAPRIAAYTDIRRIMKDFGDAFNQPDLESVIDPDKAAEFAGAMMALAHEGDADAEYEQPTMDVDYQVKSPQQPGQRSGKRALAGVR